MIKALCVQDVAKRYQVSTTCIYNWVRQRKIPFSKIGGTLVRFREEDLDLWERAQSSPVLNATEAAGQSSGKMPTVDDIAAVQARLSLAPLGRS